MKNYEDFQGGESVWKSIEKWHFWDKEGPVCRCDLGDWMLFYFFERTWESLKDFKPGSHMNKFCFRQIVLAKYGLRFEEWNGNGGKGN